jgi:hypothetical protein
MFLDANLSAWVTARSPQKWNHENQTSSIDQEHAAPGITSSKWNNTSHD